MTQAHQHQTSQPSQPSRTDVTDITDATGTDAAPHAHHGYIGSKKHYQVALRRVEGQIRGLQRMVDDEQYCIDILTQISAVTGALQRVALDMLEEHLSHCVVRAAQAGGPEAEEKVREASDAIARLVRR